ncbi:MAG: porin PorA family protein [Candidatus Woesebacteria bacterium]|jgi:PAS domain S-box-containing protein
MQKDLSAAAMIDRVKKWLLIAKVLAMLLLLALLGAWGSLFAKEILEMPVGYTYTADIVSYDNLYDSQKQQYSGSVQSKTLFSYKASGAEGDVNTVDALFSVSTVDDEPIFSVTRQYGIDHESFMHVKGHGDKDREGYLFGPKGVVDSFKYWHINYDQPLTMMYDGEEDIQGLKTIKYTSHFTADQTANLTNLSDVGVTKGINLDGEITLWIEPETGDLIKYQDAATAYYYNLATGERIEPWNQFSNQFSFDSVANHVRMAQNDKAWYFFITQVASAVILLAVAALTAWCAIDVRNLYKLRISSVTFAINSAAIMISLIVIFAWIIDGNSDVVALFGDASEANPIMAVCVLVLCLLKIVMSLFKLKTRGLVLIILLALAMLLLLCASILCSVFGVYIPFIFGSSLMLPAVLVAVILLNVNCLVLAFCYLGKRYPAVLLASVLTLLFIGTVSVISSFYQFDFTQQSNWYRPLNSYSAILFMLLAVADWQSKPMAGGGWTHKIHKPYLWALVVIFAGVSVTGLAWNAIKDVIDRGDTLQFQADANKIENLVEHSLDDYVNVLFGARSLFAASGDIDREEWKAYVDGLDMPINYPGNQGVGFSLVVPVSQKDAVEARIRSEGFLDFAINPVDPPRDEYTAIVYLEPFDERNQRAFGYDMFSEPVRHEAMSRAKGTYDAAASGKVTLLQETSEDVQAGFLIYVPVYKGGAEGLVSQDEKDDLLGYVYSPIRMGDFMDSVIKGQTGGIGVEVFDSEDKSSASDQNLMYSSSTISDANAAFSAYEKVEIGGRTWTVYYYSLPGYVTSISQGVPIAVLVAGYVISVLLGLVVFGLVNSRQRALRLAQNITKDLKFERNMAVRTEKKDEAILSSIGEGLILYGVNGTIERMNEASLKMLGIKNANVVGMEFTEVLKAADKNGKPLAHIKRPSVLAVKNNQLINTKLIYFRKDGSHFPAEITVAPISTPRGGVIGAVEVFRDITQEEALDQAKTDFISLASHQLRTPLTNTKWLLEILMSGDVGKLKSKQQKIAKDLNDSNESLIELVVSLLNVTRIESGRIRITPTSVNVCKLVSDAVSTVSPRLKEKNQKIDFECAKLPKIMLDENMVRQVVLNLLTNAIKYSPNDTQISVSVTRDGKDALVKVKDNGYGIPKEQQKDVFGKFFRAKNIAQKVPEGNGLGLYLVEQIVRASGGKIWFESIQDKGTAFYFTVPLKGVHAKKGEVAIEERGVVSQ